MLQRGSDSLEDTNTANLTTLANGVESVELADVKDSEKHTDKPPKLRGEASGLFWGGRSPGPDSCGGQARGASSPAHRRARERLQP